MIPASDISAVFTFLNTLEENKSKMFDKMTPEQADKYNDIYIKHLEGWQHIIRFIFHIPDATT